MSSWAKKSRLFKNRLLVILDTYLAWYADVDHSVRKVESGHRLVLTYNLIQQNSNPNNVTGVSDNYRQNLNNVLKLWDDQDREAESGESFNYTWEKLVYLLEHEYSEANIRLDQLKGKDQLRMRYLSEACRDQELCFYLAHFQFSKFGSVDGNEDDPNWAARADIYEFLDELQST